MLHNLLAEDTGPLGAVVMRPDTPALAGFPPSRGQQSTARAPRSLVCALPAVLFPFRRGLTSYQSLQRVLFSGAFFLSHFSEDTMFWQFFFKVSASVGSVSFEG